MFSRLKSAVKGAVGIGRATPEVKPAPPRTSAPVVPFVPRAAPSAAAPVVAAPVAAAPVVAAPVVAAPAVVAPVAAAPVVAAPVAATPVAAVVSADPAVPKKLSIAERAAAAAKAPAPVAAHNRPAEDDDDHDDDHAHVKKSPGAANNGHAQPLHADMGSTNREAYILRAKANGRDPATVIGEEGMNALEDGTQFWGPLNNSSSRAKAEGRVLTVDQFECISCGTCVEQTDRVFYLPNDGKATPIAQDGPMDLIEDAIEACPVTCIHWTTAAEATERGLATGMGDDPPPMAGGH